MVLDDVQAKLKKAAEKYGIKERGLRDELKYRVASFRKTKCLETLQACLDEIKDDHNLQEDWPSSGYLEQLLEMPQGLFQWEHTAITYIGERSPPSRLRGLLQRPAAWCELDDLYHQIHLKAFDEVKLDPMRTELLSWILGSLVVAPNPISLDVIATLYGDHAIFDGINQEDII
ncbi:hypothetical protein FS837_012653 [Tulasnella sp. UAMH 9824]|nr:hypothetical protein FS837_012653 [Tulasnella sp. UAMH 9824]